MSYTIKNNISFDEYEAIINKVVNDSFADGVYSPACSELSYKVALTNAFVPDFDFSDCTDNNTLWEKVNSLECIDILDEIKKKPVYANIDYSVHKIISHRLRAIENNPMSMSDIALSKLIDVVTAKIDSIDTGVLNKDTISALINAQSNTDKEGFEGRLVDEMLDRGLLTKPNRATRRNNIKQTKTAKSTANKAKETSSETTDVENTEEK